jgi:two-component system, chemotaxis family, chemotaxis protein CheY
MALNVLVVDDSAVMRSMIIKTLHLSGVPLAEVYQAANGQEGLNVLKDIWIDLALIDINMPVMGGEEMIDHVRQGLDTKDLPIIVVSTESSDTRISLLQQMGAQFVHKPFTPELLRDRIVGMTGVTDDEQDRDGAVSDGGLDF